MIVKIDGAPGAGKTHTLKEKLREEKAEGAHLSDFYWLTFTRSGREDVETVIEEVYSTDDEDDAGDRARTFHSLALSNMIWCGEIDPDTIDDVIIAPNDDDSKKHYRRFCESNGLGWDPNYSDPRKLLSGDKRTSHTGNLLFAVNDWLSQKVLPPERWRTAPVDLPVADENVPKLLEAWDEYKKALTPRLWEHADYVQEAFNRSLVPDVDVLFVDEFQDLAPVEYQLYKLWRDNIDRVYIAGDSGQAIYSFRGGTPLYFEETDVDETIELSESWRCAAEIASVGNGILRTGPTTDARNFSGKDAGGRVDRQSISTTRELRQQVVSATQRYDEPVFLLTRTRRQRYRLMEDLKEVGVPFDTLGTVQSVWSGDLGRVLRFLTQYLDGREGFGRETVRTVLESLPEGEERYKTVLNEGIGKFLERQAVEPALDDFDDVEELVNALEIPAWKRKILQNALDSPGDVSPNDVLVGTIHASKGLEAPAVFLFTSSTKHLDRRYSRSANFADEEHRVYYVGVTRASDELVLVSDYFAGPTAPPIERVMKGVAA